MKRIFRRTVVATAVLAALALSGTALAVDEVEPNQPIQMAQRLIIPASGSITVNGVVGVLSGTAVQDVDFYSFIGKAGDVVTIDIDGGFRAGKRDVDTWIAIFGPGPSFTMKAWNDDASVIDEGSASRLDSRIEKFQLDTDGVWTVGVTGLKRRLTDGGVYASGFTVVDAFRGNGDYTLTISGVTPSVQQISIDVKPGTSGDPAPVNPKAKGTIPVALLSSAQFNALDIKTDAKSLTFGRTGSEESLRKCGEQGEDVNGDGRLDLVCHFENQVAKFTAEDDRGTVRGMTKAGLPFEGHGMLKVVPVKPSE
jgi:hypothetical protein